MYRTTSQFYKKNPNVIFTRADKGNVTVALERQDYIIAMEKLLHDKNTYTIIKKNPIKNVERNLNSIIKVWLKNKFISKQTYSYLYSSDSNLPKAYGLPKIHKDNYPLRIIVSSVNTTLYAIAKFMHNIISNSL